MSNSLALVNDSKVSWKETETEINPIHNTYTLPSPLNGIIASNARSH